MNRQQKSHYRAWVDQFYGVVGGRVGVLPGTIDQLWHGDLADRGYGVRFSPIADHGFDPDQEIALGAEGAWRWSSNKPAMHQSVSQYS